MNAVGAPTAFVEGMTPDEIERAWKDRQARIDARVERKTVSRALASPKTAEFGGARILRGVDLAAPLPALDYLVPELGLVAGAGAPHLVAGYGFSGKTLALQEMALELAAGVRVWGALSCPAARRVIHVDFEQGERLTMRRYQRLALALGIDLAALKNLQALIMPRITLASDQHRGVWKELMTGADLIIIDSLKAATGNLDENDSNIRGALDMLGSLSEETACRALLIHHARKFSPDDPGGRYAIRGSSAIFDACDSAYIFSAQKDEPVLSEHVKARSHGEPTENIALAIEDVAVDGDAKAGVRVSVRAAELVQQRREEKDTAKRKERAQRDVLKVREALMSSPGLGRNDLAARAQLTGTRLSAALVVLGEEVDVREEKDGRTRRVRHFLRGGSC